MKAAIEVQNLQKIYKNGLEALKGINLSIPQGSFYGLLGPNGAGKTTSFYMIVGLVKPYSGDVFLDNVNITKLPMYKRAQLGDNLIV